MLLRELLCRAVSGGVPFRPQQAREGALGRLRGDRVASRCLRGPRAACLGVVGALLCLGSAGVADEPGVGAAGGDPEVPAQPAVASQPAPAGVAEKPAPSPVAEPTEKSAQPPAPSQPAPAAEPAGVPGLALSAFVQARYTATVDSQNNLAESTFSVPRARVGIAGQLAARTKYELSADMGSGGVELFTGFAEITVHRNVSIAVGQMRVPFSRSTLTPEERLTFPERSLATGEFAYLRDIGVTARAHILADRLEFILAAFNGAGPNRGNDNLDPLLLFRVAGAPLGQAWQPAEGDPRKTRHLGLMLGGTVTMDYVPAPNAYGYLSGSAAPARPITDRDTDHDGRVDDVRVVELAGDLALRFRGFALECELYQRRENWKQIPYQPGTVPLPVQNRFRAWFGQVSYFILPERLQVAARASVARVSPLSVGGRVRPEATCTFPDASTAACHLPYADVRSELAGLVAFHYSGLRFSGSFARYRWSSDGATQPPAATENQFTLQTQWAL